MRTPLSPLRSVAVVLLLAVVATLLNIWLDLHISVAGLTLVYLLAVLVASALLPRWAGVLASVLCVSALNFFFIPPRYSFQVDGPEYLLTLCFLLAFSLGVNALIASLRERGAQADLRREQAEALHALGEQLAACKGGSRALADSASGWLQTHLGVPCAVYLTAPSLTQDTDPLLCCPSPPGQADFQPRAARWAMENRRSLGRGCTDWADLPLWCGPFNARSPAGAVQLLLTDDQDTPSLAERTHWQSLVRQIGLCVERERAAELARDAISASQGEAVRNAVLAGLSHDLRTPLAGIMGSASALREQHERLTPAQRDSLLLNLEHLARDMTRMADNTLHWARLGETPQLKLQWNSIEELVGVAIARARQRWSSPGIELRVGKDLPLVNVEAPLLMQVLANLLDNAARHGGAASGKILVQAGRCRDGVFIAVRDHGPGLPPGNPADLFQRFRRPAVTGDHTGAGLGLFLCQTIAQAHGGRLEARHCTPHPGAEFYLELPLTENNPEGVSL